jgi:hypothetical protein
MGSFPAGSFNPPPRLSRGGGYPGITENHYRIKKPQPLYNTTLPRAWFLEPFKAVLSIS